MVPVGRISSTSLGYAMSEQPDGVPHTSWHISGTMQSTWSGGDAAVSRWERARQEVARPLKSRFRLLTLGQPPGILVGVDRGHVQGHVQRAAQSLIRGRCQGHVAH